MALVSGKFVKISILTSSSPEKMWLTKLKEKSFLSEHFLVVNRLLYYIFVH